MKLAILATALALLVLGAASAQAKVTWVPWSGRIPPGAVQGGEENGGPLYLCRTHFHGGVHPGKIVAGHCHISYGGREYAMAAFDVAVGTGHWGALIEPMAADVLRGGHENNHDLVVCKAHYIRGGLDRGWHPGKIVAGRCDIAWGGREYALAPYLVFYEAGIAGGPSAYATGPFATEARVGIKDSKGTLPLKRPEQIALMFLTAIENIEDDCRQDAGHVCTMKELLAGPVSHNSWQIGRLKFDPAIDPNYRYALRVSGLSWEARADPRKPGLGGLYFRANLGFVEVYFNPAGPATAHDKEILDRFIFGDSFVAR